MQILTYMNVFQMTLLNDYDYQTQVNRLTELTSIPSYRDMNSTNCTWIRYNNDPMNSNIKSLLETIQTLTTEFVVIEVTSPNYYANYLLRNREGERYSKEDLEIIDAMYQKYTKHLRDMIKPVYINM